MDVLAACFMLPSMSLLGDFTRFVMLRVLLEASQKSNLVLLGVCPASKAGEKSAEEAQSPALPLPSPPSLPEEVKPSPDDNPFAGLFKACASLLLLPFTASVCVPQSYPLPLEGWAEGRGNGETWLPAPDKEGLGCACAIRERQRGVPDACGRGVRGSEGAERVALCCSVLLALLSER